MYFDHSGTTGNDRLRFVFGATVVSRNLAADTTYGDIARMFDETARMRHGNPISVDVMIGCRVPPALARGDANWRPSSPG